MFLYSDFVVPRSPTDIAFVTKAIKFVYYTTSQKKFWKVFLYLLSIKIKAKEMFVIFFYLLLDFFLYKCGP